MSILDKIKSDLEHWKPDGVQDDFESGAMYMRDYALMVIEKYSNQERKTGRWLFACEHWYKCSICGNAEKDAEAYSYCPYCGSRMVRHAN